MDIRNRRDLHTAAENAVANAPAQKHQTVLVYTGITFLLALASCILTYYLDTRIAGTGGLGNMGLRSTLSTIQTVLPMVQTLVLLGLEVGFYRSVLNIARGGVSQPRTLMEGFHRFGPMLRAQLFMGLIYGAIMVVSINLGAYIFVALPLSNPFMELIAPFMEAITTGDAVLLETQMQTMDADMAVSMTKSMIPYAVISLILFAVLFVPLFYRYRMVTFCLADNSRMGAIAAMRTSRKLMYRKGMALFRLDLSLWWYYLLQLLVVILCYGGTLLAVMGIQLPLPPVLNLFLFPVLSLVAQFAVHYFVLNRVLTTYAFAYESLKEPPKPQDEPNLPFQV